MPDFMHPFWLLALGVIPLIRWLHRWQSPLSSWPVSAIFLWQKSAIADQSGDERRQPEPAWRRRALIAALVITALSGPYLQQDSRMLTVWIDDSLSLSTVENNSTRLSTMLHELSQDLIANDSKWEQVTLRSLTIPGKAYRRAVGEVARAEQWQPDPGLESKSSSIPFLSVESSHWLLTDGAGEVVQNWANKALPDRVIQTGHETENSAITRLAIRRGIAEDRSLEVLVSITNTGLATDMRQVALLSGQRVLQTRDISLLPGETSYWRTQVIAAENSISAALILGDFLAIDDELNLSLDKFRALATYVDTSCGPALLRALATHPALGIIDNVSRASLIVSCQREFITDENSPASQIRVWTGPTTSVESSPTWFSDEGIVRDLSFPKEWISAATPARKSTGVHSKTILIADDRPLIAVRNRSDTSPTIVDTVLDMSHPMLIRQAEYAALVAVLVDLATGRQLLDETVIAKRDARESTVIPKRIDARPERSTAARQATIKPLSTVFMLAALLILALDAAMLVRARRGAPRA